MTCNSRCASAEGDAGAWRRALLIVRYEKRAGHAYPGLSCSACCAMRQRDFALGLAGFVKLQTEFCGDGRFQAFGRATRAGGFTCWRKATACGLFVRDGLERHEYGDLRRASFQQAYAEFCADQGWNALPSRSDAMGLATLQDIRIRQPSPITVIGNAFQPGRAELDKPVETRRREVAIFVPLQSIAHETTAGCRFSPAVNPPARVARPKA